MMERVADAGQVSPSTQNATLVGRRGFAPKATLTRSPVENVVNGRKGVAYSDLWGSKSHACATEE